MSSHQMASFKRWVTTFHLKIDPFGEKPRFPNSPSYPWNWVRVMSWDNMTISISESYCDHFTLAIAVDILISSPKGTTVQFCIHNKREPSPRTCVNCERRSCNEILTCAIPSGRQIRDYLTKLMFRRDLTKSVPAVCQVRFLETRKANHPSDRMDREA